MHRTKAFKVLLVSAALAFVAGGDTVGAQEGSKLNFVPTLGVDLTFDDNVYSGNGQTSDPASQEYEVDDTITHIKPSMAIKYNLPARGTVGLGVDLDFARYDKESANDWKSSKVALGFDYKSPKGLLFALNGSITNSEDPYGNDVDYNVGKVTKRQTNALETKLGYDFGNGFKATAFYKFEGQDYDLDADRAQDNSANQFGVGVEKKLLPKTWGFVRYSRGTMEYDGLDAAKGDTVANAADYDWDRIDLGLAWDPDAKLGGELNFGYKSVEFDNLTDGTNTYRDQDQMVIATSINYKISEATAATLNVARDVRVSGGTSYESSDDLSYGVSLSHKFYTKFSGKIGISTGTTKYDTVTPKEDDSRGYDASLEYQVRKWLTANIGYKYSEKDSTDNTSDYEKKEIFLGLKGSFDRL